MFLTSRRAAQVALACVIAGAVLSVPAVRVAAFRTAGSVLVVDDQLERADVIVVPQWAGVSGALDAAELVRAGLADRVAVVGGPASTAELELARRNVPYQDSAVALVEMLRHLGVEKVEVIPNDEASTRGESVVLSAWCDAQNIQSVIVMSSPDHSRRVRRTLNRSIAKPVRLMVRSSRYSSFDSSSWWETRLGTRTMIVEFQKLLLDVALHPLS